MGEWGEIYTRGRERGTRGEMGERKSVGREMEERGEGVERDGREGRGSGERCCVLGYCVKFK